MNTKDIMALLNKLDELKEAIAPSSDQSENGFLKFTEKEIIKMPTSFRKQFRAQGCTAYVRKRSGGRYRCSYEVRYRRDGYNISVSAPTLERAKERFIEALKNAEQKPKTPHVEPVQPVEPEKKEEVTLFNDFATYYFETFRKRAVAERTFDKDMNRYKNHILPVFGDMPLQKITPAHVQPFLDTLSDKPKTAYEVRSLLSIIFKMAIKHNIITQNPCDIVILDRYEKQHGKALPKAEERLLLDAYEGSPYQTMFAVALYTGLRPNEYKTARVDNGFIVARNSKQKDKREHFKRIPISPMLAPYITGTLQFYGVNHISEKLHAVLPGHKLYDFRTTFYTRCQECGVSEVARNLFVGHSLGGLADTYTDISDEYLIAEAAKLKY